MKKISILLLTTLLSVNAFADNSGSLSFDLSNKDEADAKDPYFHCDVTNDKGHWYSGTKIKFTTDAPINLGEKGKVIEGISVSNTKNYYFYVTKDERGEGRVSYSTDNGSDIVCAKGKGEGRTAQYNK